jgi:hypothetical protein
MLSIDEEEEKEEERCLGRSKEGDRRLVNAEERMISRLLKSIAVVAIFILLLQLSNRGK